MTKAEKIKRGEEILQGFEALRRTHEILDEKNRYAAEILRAISEYTYDAPIPRKDMALALAEAEIQGKKVYIVPDPSTMDRCDGWEYFLEIR